jgi:dTMP kinase
MSEEARGKFFVIEGTDGSGKTVQLELLSKRLTVARFDLATFDFPQYGKPSAYFVEQYLGGKYGTIEEVGPYRASVFYSVDRFDIGRQIKAWLSAGKIILANRYVPSNMGHQGAKIADEKERKEFLEWVYEFEYEIMAIPKPAISVILHVPAEVAFELKKAQRGNKKRDIHEDSLPHLKQAEQVYLELPKLFPDDFILVECVRNGKLLSVEEVHEKVWAVIEPFL